MSNWYWVAYCIVVTIVAGFALAVIVKSFRDAGRSIAAMGGIEVQGFDNPALCLMHCLKAQGAEVDEPSFEAVAALCAKEYEGGFVVDSYETMERLCELGGFCIFHDHTTGRITAMMVEERA